MEAVLLLAAVLLIGFWLGRRGRRRAAASTEPESPRRLTSRTAATDRGGSEEPRFLIRYRDEKGSVTEREVRVLRWNRRAGTVYFTCWCYGRDAERTFRSDRIESVIDQGSGEVITDWVGHLKDAYR